MRYSIIDCANLLAKARYGRGLTMRACQSRMRASLFQFWERAGGEGFLLAEGIFFWNTSLFQTVPSVPKVFQNFRPKNNQKIAR